MALNFKRIGDETIGLEKECISNLKRQSSNLPSDGGTVLYVLDGNVDGFLAAYFRTDDFVGITIVPPLTRAVEEAAPRFLDALRIILPLSIGHLDNADRMKVILHLIGEKDYFSGRAPDLTADLTDIINHSCVENDARLNYAGTKTEDIYLFELPGQGSLFACGRYVKVDMGHPYMKTAAAGAFFRRLSFDLTLCRGQHHFVVELSGPLGANEVLYLMFRDKVSADMKWWTDLNNVAHVCAAIKATIIKEEGCMYLDAICSRPGTRGAVAQMLANISIDARDAYHLSRLVLTPANNDLRDVYERLEYGFKLAGGNKMVKDLTEAGETGAAAAARKPSDELFSEGDRVQKRPRTYTEGGKRKISRKQRRRSSHRRTAVSY